MPLPGPLPSMALVAHGLVSRRDALAAGVDDRELRTLVRGGELVRVHRGHYCDAAVWHRLDGVQQHVLRARSVLANAGAEAHLGHVTALAAYGADLWQPDLTEVHLLRDAHRGRREAGVVHHGAEFGPDERVLLDGMRSCVPQRALLDYARDPDVRLAQAVVAMDSLLHRGVVTHQALRDDGDRMRAWKGSRGAQRAVRLADGRAESVGESRCRVDLTAVGFAPEDLQFVVVTGTGTARADFAWQSRGVLGEFDGRAKYGRLLEPGQDPSDVAWAERRRELAIEREGWVVVRFVWADLGRPARILELLLDAFARAERLGLPRVS